MTKPPASFPALAALAALTGWLAVAPAAADAGAAGIADGGSSGSVEIGDDAELDEESLRDLVGDAQRILTLRGYDAGPIDGRLGLRTQRAIRAYQDAARQQGYLEAVKGPPAPEPGGAAEVRRELVRMEDAPATAR